MIETVLTAIYL